MKRRRGAAVAAALKSQKKKGGGKMSKGSEKSGNSNKPSGNARQKEEADVHEDDPLQDFLNETHDSEKMFGQRVLLLEKIMAQKHANDKTVLIPSERKDLVRQRQIDGMSTLVTDRIERNSNYTACFCLTVFFLLACFVLVAQRDVAQAFMIEGSMFVAMMGDLDIEAAELTRSDDFYDWLKATSISRIFSDPACGDGVCDSPDEFPGFGRFGCIPDCGRYKKTTKINVKLEDFFEYSKSQTNAMHPDNSKMSNWDFTPILDKSKEIYPEYRWNLWSDTMGDYIFAEAQMPTTQPNGYPVDVPDGRLELRLFQHRKVSEEVDVGTIFDQLYLLPTTLPKRTALTDFTYGDKLEAIASAAVFMKQVNDWCYGGTADQTPSVCKDIPTVDTMFKALGSYGLQGKITKPDPESTSKIPQPKTLATIGFCGLLANGTQGLKNRYNKIELQAAGIDCGNRRSAPGSARRLLPSSAQRVWPEIESDSPARHLLQMDTHGGDLEARFSESGGGRKLLQAGGSARFGTCVQHGDCNQNVLDYVTSGSGQFCDLRAQCDTCSFCQIDGADAINGLCPKAYCPLSGELPGCLSALRMSPKYECADKTEFELWRYHTKGVETPKVVPDGLAKVRYVTPYNRLIGPIMITQKRRQTGNCSKVVNPFIKSWAENGLDSRDGCLQAENQFDGSFFGLDPAFVPTTALYDGTLIAEEHYALNERLNKTIAESTSRGVTVVTYPSVPMGFYPYQYDLFNHTFKIDGTYRQDEADSFKVYFDTQITQSQANTMLDFMKDGGFIDGSTSSIEAQIITYNAELNRFTLLVFTFDWTAGGSISWSYWVESVVLDIYDLPTGVGQAVFEIVLVVLFSVNVWLELVDILVAVRSNRLFTYVSNIGNLFDWLHFACMGTTIYLWLEIKRLTDNFTIREDSYPVLSDPYAGARVFTVDTVREEDYLQFRDDILLCATTMRLYNACAGVTIILFTFRLLKALDFQPIMGIVTRTLWAATFDMAHFVVLFTLISFGYAFAAVLMFGHQFSSAATPSEAFMLLFDIILVMDTGVFWQQMTHACANSLFFHLFIWSWIIVGFFLLINIFLAIVIDAYIAVKEEDTSKLGMHEELGYMFNDWWKSHRLSKTKYMTDTTLLSILQEKQMGLPSTYQLREAVLESMEEDLGIVLEGGIHINKHSMRRILRGPLDVETVMAESEGKKVETGEQPSSSELQDSSDDDEDVNWRDLEEECVVGDLMDRYAAGEKGEEGQIMDAMRIDSMKRAVAMFRHQQWITRKLHHSAEVCERLALRIVPASKQAMIAKQAAAMKAPPKEIAQSKGLLRVTIVEASNLPKLDLMRASDPYCLVFLTNENGDPGEIVYRTEVVPHNANPVFNEEFLFSLYSGVDKVSVLIYDEDHITNDDLIGSAQVSLDSLDPWVPTERWLQVRNTDRDDDGIKLSKMRVQLTLQPANVDFDGEDSYVSQSAAGPARTGRAGVGGGDLRLLDASQSGDHSFNDVEISTDRHPFGTGA